MHHRKENGLHLFKGTVGKILPSSGHILECSINWLTLPLPREPVNYGGLGTLSAFFFVGLLILFHVKDF